MLYEASYDHKALLWIGSRDVRCLARGAEHLEIGTLLGDRIRENHGHRYQCFGYVDHLVIRGKSCIMVSSKHLVFHTPVSLIRTISVKTTILKPAGRDPQDVAFL